jgi:hypothetical protein
MTSDNRLTSWAVFHALVTGQIDRQLRQQVEFVLAENRILRSQITSRLRLDDEQRIVPTTVGKPLGRSVLDRLCTIVTPDTLLRWHRELVAKKFDSCDRRVPRLSGRPPTDPKVVELVLRMSGENPS